VQLFSGEVKGLAVRLPNWQYPVVVDVDGGKLHCDNFEVPSPKKAPKP
jgi:hypothetical protein